MVDVERARTVKGWKPRRLGGGLGGRERKPSSSTRASSRDKYSDRKPSGYRDERKRSRMRSRSRSPKGYKDRSSGYGRRDRSRDRMGSRRDRY